MNCRYWAWRNTVPAMAKNSMARATLPAVKLRFAEEPHVEHRLVAAELPADERDARNGSDGEGRASGVDDGPAVLGGVDDGVDERADGGGRQQRADGVEAGRRAGPGSRARRAARRGSATASSGTLIQKTDDQLKLA